MANSVALSQLKELGEQAIVALAASLACGGPVVRGQLIASRFYEALPIALKHAPIHDAKRAALIAASDRCERIAAATINPSAMLDELRKAIAVLEADTHPLVSHTLETVVCLQVRKTHLDLLALVAGFGELGCTDQGARRIPCVLMHVPRDLSKGHIR